MSIYKELKAVAQKAMHRGPCQEMTDFKLFVRPEDVVKLITKLNEAIEIMDEINDIYQDVRIPNSIDSFSLQPLQVFLREMKPSE